MLEEGSSRNFSFKLADGISWQFFATPETESIVAHMNQVMWPTQRPLTGSNKLYFFTGDLNDNSLPDIAFTDSPESFSLPENGWSVTRLKHVHIWRHEHFPDIICKVDKTKGKTLDIRRIYQSLYPAYQGIILSGGSPLHAALIEYNGNGVLIAGTSGTGKSTCCRRIKAPWRAVCDDETLVVRTGNSYRVHPFPTWNDYIARHSKKTYNVQQHLPLSAIFFLRQSMSDKVEIAGKGMAAYSLYRSSLQIYSRYKPDLSEAEIAIANKQLFENACKISNEVPSYVLYASLRGRFWDEMEKVLNTG
ncbi:SynChlorMet cassette protein ScmC [Methanocella sp. MCL-LM]|uniref:SynChlorMet cassette protein ScmC n=1 Tax=Methanocella sp. MCL-LM TaxID=3412035 RepID=UPI003C72485D